MHSKKKHIFKIFRLLPSSVRTFLQKSFTFTSFYDTEFF